MKTLRWLKKLFHIHDWEYSTDGIHWVKFKTYESWFRRCTICPRTEERDWNYYNEK